MDTDTYDGVLQCPLDQPCSAQLMDLKALKVVCNLFTAFTYAYGVCHTYRVVRAQRGLANGTKIVHGGAISDLLLAMQLPNKLIMTTSSFHIDSSVITRGNNAAD